MGQIKRGREFLRYLWMPGTWPGTRGLDQWAVAPWVACHRPNLRARRRSNHQQVVPRFLTLEGPTSWRLVLPSQGALTTPVHKSCQGNQNLRTLERGCQRKQGRIASQAPLQRSAGLKTLVQRATPTVGRLTSVEKLPGLALQIATQRNARHSHWRINVTATRTPSVGCVSAGIQILLLQQAGSLQGLAVV